MIDGMPDRVSAAYSIAGDEPVVRRVFSQVYRRADSERQNYYKRRYDDVQRIQYVRQDAYRVGKVARLGREQLPAYVRQPFVHNIYNQKNYERGAEQR